MPCGQHGPPRGHGHPTKHSRHTRPASSTSVKASRLLIEVGGGARLDYHQWYLYTCLCLLSIRDQCVDSTGSPNTNPNPRPKKTHTYNYCAHRIYALSMYGSSRMASRRGTHDRIIRSFWFSSSCFLLVCRAPPPYHTYVSLLLASSPRPLVCMPSVRGGASMGVGATIDGTDNTYIHF